MLDRQLEEIIKSNDDYLVKAYHFIDKTYLAAIVDKRTGKEKLGMIFYDGNDMQAEYIDCIHTGVTLSLDEIKNQSEEELMLNAWSSEERREINLAPEEAFKALKSWVEGIAKAGLDAFKIQAEIEQMAKFAYPLSSQLIKFVAKYNKDVLGQYVDKVLNECKVDNNFHKPSLTANLLALRETPGSLDYLLSAAFSLKEKDVKVLWDTVIEVYGKESVAENPNATRFPEYVKLITDDDKEARKGAARNPNATRFPEYVELITDNDFEVKQQAAENPNAPQFPEFKNLIESDNWAVRATAAENPNAPQFSWFRELFDNPTIEILVAIAHNKNAMDLKEYKERKVLEFIRKRKIVFPADFAFNQYAARFPEYVKVFASKDWNVRASAAENPDATRFPEYVALFTDSTFIRKIAARNPNAPKFSEYVNLIRDRDWEVRASAARNPNATQFAEFKELFDDQSIDVLISLAYNERARNLKEYKKRKKFFKFIRKHKIQSAYEFVKNPKAAKFPEYVLSEAL